MMGFAEAGYANTCGGALDDLSFEYVCTNERNWTAFDGDGDFRLAGSFANLIAALADPKAHAAALAASAARGASGIAAAVTMRRPAAVEDKVNARLGVAVTGVEWGRGDGWVRLSLKPAAAAVAAAEVAEVEATASGCAASSAATRSPATACSACTPCSPPAEASFACWSASASAGVLHGAQDPGAQPCPAGPHAEVLEAEVVVVTVPLPLLRGNVLPRFSPPLPPAKVAAAFKVEAGVAAKLLLLFEGLFPPWPANLHGAVCADCAVPEFWFRTVSGPEGSAPQHLCTGFLMGRFRDEAVARGKAATVRLACAQLDDMFGLGGGLGGGGGAKPSCSAALAKSALHDWGAEPFARCGYTHCPSLNGACEADFRILAAAVPVAGGGALLFAGEGYISAGANMTVHSALDAGHRAAGEAAAVLAARGPVSRL